MTPPKFGERYGRSRRFRYANRNGTIVSEFSGISATPRRGGGGFGWCGADGEDGDSKPFFGSLIAARRFRSARKKKCRERKALAHKWLLIALFNFQLRPGRRGVMTNSPIIQLSNRRRRRPLLRVRPSVRSFSSLILRTDADGLDFGMVIVRLPASNFRINIDRAWRRVRNLLGVDFAREGKKKIGKETGLNEVNFVFAQWKEDQRRHQMSCLSFPGP